MATQRRKFTDDQKLEILNQAEQMGVTAVLRNHNLSYSVFAKWKEKAGRGDSNRQAIIQKNRTKYELKQYIEENTRLKKIIADQALELERKDEELKKINPSYNKR
jgi:putative transposase